MGAFWTDERKALVKRLWTEGLSAAQIGKRLSLTRNAIIGGVHRLGLPPRLPSFLDQRQRRYNGNRPPRISFGAKPQAAPKGRQRVSAAVKECPPITAAPVLFMDRKLNHCAWILDDQVPISERQCCGGETYRHTSWCKAHLRIVSPTSVQ